ncbi:Ig-like domain repeat protein [Schumannella soli]|uniref:Fibronectin type-III domain-containing protein n=1 Tax=Schumannella soli TaxID=2590779 RepID=A0A506XNQ4_9MICO|nr:Ig-like domain repeat protein [Schumannella soli]TPW74241.1 hypothetical protein FJ657_16620 [Schumannella soli]
MTISSWSSRGAAALGAILLAAGGVAVVGVPASAATSPCLDGSTPAALSSVSCGTAGNYTLTVPAGTTGVEVTVRGGGGGAGYPARSHIGGNAAEVRGDLTLPAGTAHLYVVVGVAGTGDNHGTSGGGGGSAVMALDAGHNLIAKLVIAGGGGGGAYNGDGGSAGLAGTSDNAQAVSGPGSAGVGAVGGAGGTGNYAAGTAGGSNNAGAATVAAGGTGGLLPSSARGGAGGGGYAGGGGGGASTQGILNTNVAGGGGGSSLASAYLANASIGLAGGTGGVQLPGLVAGDGATGSVTLAFDGPKVPDAPRGASALAGDRQASVTFTAPASDGGSPITGYTVTASPGGVTAACAGSPCVVTGLVNGTDYTFQVHATNANGDSAESAASAAVTPSTLPGAPTIGTATAGDASASVTFTAPADNGGAAVTQYTVTSAPGGLTGSCAQSPCTVTGLTNGASYVFTVTATNLRGNSPASGASNSVKPFGVAGAPGAVAAEASDTAATVTFSAPAADGGSAVTGYTVTSTPGGIQKSCGASPCTVTGLTNGTSYTFTVHADNARGASAESTPSNAVTPFATTTTAVSVATATPTAGTLVPLEATVTPSSGSVASVEFYDGATLIGSAPVDAGTARLSADLAAGSHQITARFVGDAAFASSTSTATTVIVAPEPTTTTVSVASDEPTAGAPVDLEATVSPSEGSVAAVEFYDGDTLLDSAAVDAGVARVSVVLPAGERQITARFVGDDDYASSTSAAVAVTVARQESTITLAVLTSDPNAGSPVTLEATVTPGGSTGDVEFYDGETLLGSAPLESGAARMRLLAPSSRAVLSVSLSAGEHRLSAVFAGDGQSLSSVSDAEIVLVDAAPVTPPATGTPTSPTGAVTPSTGAAAPTATRSSALASTGFDGTPALLAALLLVVAGVVLRTARRPRRD